MTDATHPRTRWLFAVCLVVLLVAGIATGASVAGGTTATRAAVGIVPSPAPAVDAGLPGSAQGAVAAVAAVAEPTVEQLVGQKLVIRMNGTTPSAALLGRIGRGEVGGVILFAFNITSAAQLRSVTAKLQGAAAASGQPKLLVMVDQEGGGVRRITWAPPKLSARAVGYDGRTTTARTLGEATGTALHDLGINVNLAPVADVPTTASSFMYLAWRTYAFSETKVARLANAFAAGLRAKGVLATMKHFPGIGRAKLNTDHNVVTIKASRASLAQDLYPFKAAIAAGVPLIMLSNATYSAYDTVNGAGWSPAIATTLLRHTLGFTGVSITDSLSGNAAARGIPARVLAAKAARAGTDLIILTGYESSTDAAFDSLVTKVKDGRIPIDVLKASYARILALKAKL